jgi:hypothetical protein
MIGLLGEHRALAGQRFEPKASLLLILRAGSGPCAVLSVLQAKPSSPPLSLPSGRGPTRRLS